jgi:peptide/nickel transport system substrate-binding protein
MFLSSVELVDTVEATGEREVTFSLNSPDASFPNFAMHLVPILPVHEWADVDDPTSVSNDEPIGSGPFQFNQLRETEFIEYETFDEHPFAPSYSIHRLGTIGNLTSATQAVVNGEYDSVQSIPQSVWGDVREASATSLVQAPSHAVEGIMYNLRRGRPYSDPEFRLALSHMIPREQMLQDIYEGNGTLGGDPIAPANSLWNNPDIEGQPISYDPERARTILEEAGYAWDDDGRLLYPVE